MRESPYIKRQQHLKTMWRGRYLVASTCTGAEGVPARSPRSSVAWKENPGTVMVAFSVIFLSIIKSPAKEPGRAFFCLVRDSCLQATRRDDADCHLLSTQNGGLGGGDIQVHRLLGQDNLICLHAHVI